MGISELYSLEQRGVSLPPQEVLAQMIPPDPEHLQKDLSQPDVLASVILQALNSESNYLAVSFVNQVRISLIRRFELVITINNKPYELSILVERGNIVSRVVITAYSEQKAAGFRDIEIRMDNKISYGHRGPLYSMINHHDLVLGLNGASIVTKYSIHDFPGFDFNIRSGIIDSFYVIPSERGRGLGTYLFFLGLALSRQMGSDIHYIQHDQSATKQKGSFYARFLRKKSDSIIGWIFPLYPEMPEVDQFTIIEP